MLVHRARALVAALTLATPIALWTSSCALDGFTKVDEAPPVDAGADTGVEAGGCPHATYPPPPTGAQPGGDIELVVAMRSVDLGETSMDPIGYDLDLQCSCQGDGPNCKPLVNDTTHCDLAEGRDNASTAVFRLLTAAFGAANFGSTFFSAGAESGNWSLLLRVRNYNGQPDDDSVRLDWYVTTSFALGGGAGAPAWDGQDAWPISAACLTSPPGGPYNIEETRYFDANAYVSGGVLVAGLPEASITFAGGVSSMSLLLSAGFVTARIEQVPGVGAGYALRDGVIVARWGVSEVFQSISSYRDDSGMPYCKNSPFYSTGKTQFCKLADILLKPSSPTALCDAMSFGIGFDTHPAALGAIFEPPPPTPGCAPEFDPATDSCPPPP